MFIGLGLPRKIKRNIVGLELSSGLYGQAKIVSWILAKFSIFGAPKRTTTTPQVNSEAEIKDDIKDGIQL